MTSSMSSLPSLAAINTSTRTPSSLKIQIAASFPSRPRPRTSTNNTRFGIKCSYTEASIKDDSNSATIDVVADIKTERVVVLGGSGFVGSAICKAAVSEGIEVISLSRSGRPSYSSSWIDQVTWMSGDVFYANWDEVLSGATAVVSTLGGFGNEEQMQRINGEANVVAVSAAKDFGVVLRPGFIYGKRRVDGFEIPLDLVGEPLERFLRATENFTKPLISIPGSDLFLAPPVSVDDVALAVINAVRDDDFFGIFTIEQIKEAAAKVRV
ncbi:NAD(P)-binding Rossmann-fold superfamily protein [Actinidia rufa]|uniref:NAD(P)-binding Rossmann-fold superfamily protein n=1 Tax=Actinidia rufa TaxID=165716 RepID=A0A7J0GCZ1_9ERIC|nr:NAD(P)-binding Rossmann-fold superfamily protein [Actinidia rufa]